MRNIRTLFLFFVSVFYVLRVQGIDYREHGMEHFNISGGMSSNNVLSIEQDRYGFMWIATDEGLNRFDGRQFTPYKKGTGNISLSNNYTQYLTASADNNNIWIATSRGLNIYDYEGDSIKIVLGGDSGGGLSSSDIISFSETPEGMWIATYDKGVDFFDYKTRTFSALELPDIFRNIYITCVYADNAGNVWIGTLSNGLYRYSLKNKSLALHVVSRVQEIVQDSRGTVWIAAGELYRYDPHAQTLNALKMDGMDTPMQITRMEEDRNGMMWIGGIVGLGYFDLGAYYRDGRAMFTEVRQKGKNFNSPFRAVNCIKVAADNNVWIGTFGDGLYMIHAEKDKFTLVEHNILDKTSLSGSKIRSMAYDEEKGVFFVATDGAGIDVLDKNLKKRDNYAVGKPNSQGLQSDNVLFVFLDTRGNLWCATNYGLNVLRRGAAAFETYLHDESDTDGSILSNTVYALAESRDGAVWICTEKGVTRYKDGKFSNEFHKLMKRRIDVRSVVVVDDYLWLGTYGDGLIAYYMPGNKVDFYLNHEDLTRNYIRGVKRMNDTLCVVTQGAGLQLFSLRDKRAFKLLNEANGLNSNYVQAVEFDGKGRIWAASNRGIACVTPDKIVCFDSKDGIPRNEFFSGMRVTGRDGAETVCFCGNEGISRFNPDDPLQYRHAYKIQFNSLKIFNQPVRPGVMSGKDNPLKENICMTEKIELDSRESFFTLGFVNINYNYDRHVDHYSYLLDGFDTEWNDIGRQQEVSFRSLPPGKYRLLVKTTDTDGDDSPNIAEMAIVIHPPFWHTPLAYVAYFILFGLLLYAVWRFSTMQMRTRHRLNMEKSERRKDEEIHQAKLRFFINISHELRTPLTLIIGPLETMRQRYPALADEISVINQNAQKLLRLVNQLLDFRKTEMKEMKLKVGHAQLTDQIRRIIASFDNLNTERRMNLSFVSSPLELSGWYDVDFVEKIMFNLLSNAYKFTGEGGSITIELTKMEKEGCEWAQIKVADNGIGIEEKELELIFKRFYQSETTTTGKGSGIGLNLVKNLVELHHGIISVNSTLNKGTCFTVEIPVDRNYYAVEEIMPSLRPAVSGPKTIAGQVESGPEAPREADEAPEPPSAGGRKINILVVDDEIGICEYIKQLLPPEYHVIFALNGKEALSTLKQQDFDMVISDVMMPEMDGLTLCKKIKTDIETSHIPVILLTAKSSLESKLEGLKTGADSYIAKPFHPEHLKIRVEKLIESRQMFKKKFGKTLSFEMEHIDNPSVDDLLLEKILKYINKNISKPELNGDRIAKDLSISRMTLHRKLKLLTGQTTSELIRGLRLKEAAYQIENTTKNISDICYEVGFNSPSYFTACFADQYGMTPTEYLKAKRDVRKKNGDDA